MVTMNLRARSSHELGEQIRLLEPDQPRLAMHQAATEVAMRLAFSIATTVACHPSTRKYALICWGEFYEVATRRRPSPGEPIKRCYESTELIVGIRAMGKQVNPTFCLGEPI